jgi:hypothetical protein
LGRDGVGVSERETDVVVAGSGAAGMMAALRSAIGAGIDDTRASVKEYLPYLTTGLIPEAVVDRFVDTAPPIIDFLEEHAACDSPTGRPGPGPIEGL